MADATWPLTLPQYLQQDGYSETLQNATLRTEMDAGPAKLRRRFTAAVRLISGTVWLTPTQAETLDVFYRATLGQGSQPFDWKHPRTQATVEMRFVNPPVLTPLGPEYQAELQLEILP